MAKGRGAGIALHAGRGAGQEDGAAAARGHPRHHGIAQQVAAVAGHQQGLFHRLGIQLGEGAALPGRGIEHYHVGQAEVRRHLGHHGVDRRAVGDVAGVGSGLQFPGQVGELVRIARGQRDPRAFGGEAARDRGTEPRAGADDEHGFGHAMSPFREEACSSLLRDS
jgi:hypothetical protein